MDSICGRYVLFHYVTKICVSAFILVLYQTTIASFKPYQTKFKLLMIIPTDFNSNKGQNVGLNSLPNDNFLDRTIQSICK